ncbi:hypothetical protein KDM41_07210 [bacterium]|nr:hypothetical protein [bacterium]
MKTPIWTPPVRTRVLPAVAVFLALTTIVLAVPLSTPVIDGSIRLDGTEWDPGDVVVDDRTDDNTNTSEGHVGRLLMTWDADNLYVGVTYQDYKLARPDTHALSIFFDLGRGVGPTSAAALDSAAGAFSLPDGDHIDLVIRRDPGQAFPGALPRVFLVTDGQGSCLPLTGDVTVAQGTGGAKSGAEALWPLYNHAEFALPWDVIYPDLGGDVPDYAVIKAVAVITAGRADLNGRDSAPDNAGLDRSANTVVLANMHASVVDVDGDGVPDPLAGSIAGTVALENDAMTSRLQVRAELVDFPTAGQEPGQAVMQLDLPATTRAYTLPRLAGGRYRVIADAVGYFPDTTLVDIATGEAATGADLSLPQAISITGNLNFEGGEVRTASLTIEDDRGDVIHATEVRTDGGAFTLYVKNSGDYVIRATAPDYYELTRDVSVVGDQDVTGVVLDLMLWTRVAGTVVLLGTAENNGGDVYLETPAGVRVDTGAFSPIEPAFKLFTPTGGDFVVRVVARPDYYQEVAVPVAVVQDVDVTGLVVELPLKTQVDIPLTFEGPDAAAHWSVRYADTDVVRKGADFATATTATVYCDPGRYRLVATAPGYVPLDIPFDVTTNDTVFDVQQLLAVRATHLELVDEDGNFRPGLRATYWDQAAGDPFTSTEVLIAARDEDGRDDLYDLNGALSGLVLSARKMDDVSPPRGTPVYYGSGDQAAPPPAITTVDFAAGRTRFWMSNTAVEVLRVLLQQPAKIDTLGSRVAIGFQDPRPETIVLTVDVDSLVADNTAIVTVTGTLYDSAGNVSLLNDVPVAFGIDGNSSGKGQFVVPSALTVAGRAQAQLRATGAGTLLLTAAVTLENRTLAVAANDLDSGETLLPVRTLPGPRDGWRLELPASVASVAGPVAVTAQLVDFYGNAVAEAGLGVSFAASPAALGAFGTPTAVSDAAGRAVGTFTPSGDAGLVTLAVDGGVLGGDAADLQLRDVVVIPDPPYDQEPAGFATFDKTDLTALIVDNTPENLLLEIPFQSDWGGLQLHVIFETENDAAGANRDPFLQPVNYAHGDRPDYALTYKYSADDYGDFRRWNGTDWDQWNTTAGDFSGGDTNIKDAWVSKLADKVVFTVPWAAFGGAPSSLRLEAYLTQQEGDDSTKRAAFDSAPQDATLNLTFDYLNPPDGAWDVAFGPTTLSQWGAPYTVKTVFPARPTLTGAVVTPAEVIAGGLVTVTVQVADGGDGIGDVLADLGEIGGAGITRMYDDGSHGDQDAGDGRYSLQVMVPLGNPGGTQSIGIQAYDGANVWASRTEATLAVEPVIEPLLVVDDPIGDDHGPNLPDTRKLYTIYPTNQVFVPGAFDIERLTVFETVATVGGQQIDMIAFQVKVGDFPDPADPGTADWGAPYADMNIAKIDILIDSDPGGTTATLPSRQAGMQPWDGWEYAIIIDGWYKAVVPSLGKNTVDSWRDAALRSDADIILVSDPDADTVTALVSRASLGDPSNEDILKWDMIVCIASHDGDADFGGVRWVNESRSEWQPGGGDNSDRDSNLFDVLAVPGAGHSAGLGQSDMLNYLSPAAQDRLAANQTPVALEMSAFEDTGPPVIDTGAKDGVVTRVDPLEGAPLALSITISDDYRVDRAEFRYRATGFRGDWQHVEAMGYLGRDRWVVDILPTFLDSLTYSPYDSTRYLEFEVWATDPLDKTTTSPVTTLEIGPTRPCQPLDADLAPADVALLHVDGSALLMSASLRDWMVQHHIEEAWQGAAVSPDTMGGAVELQWDVCTVPPVYQAAPTVPEGRPIGVYREVFLATADTTGGYLDYQGALPLAYDLSLHFPQDWLPAGTDKEKLALYQYHEESDRWVLVGGNVSLTGNNVTAAVKRPGIYGLFLTDAVSYDAGEVMSGLLISPNPFSPNGDDLYDETSISFYLTQEATVTVEVYDINGKRKKVLTQSFSFQGTDLNDTTPRRVAGIVWDGTDFRGDVVPYGVYVLRILTTYNEAGGTRTIRSNHSVAVIK